MNILTRQELGARFESVRDFKEGLAITYNDGQYFHIRRDGTAAYTTRFESVGDFKGGLAWVRLNGEYFHIQENGSPAYPCRFDTYRDEHEGRRIAKVVGFRPDGSQCG